MKTIQSVEKIELKVLSNELLENKWISFQLVSKKLNEIETQKGMTYKHLRNRLYNSRTCNKYNMTQIAGIDCIDIEKPMKATASLELSFVRG